MKLTSLNPWGASQGQIFFDYIKQQATDTDIFCFQEVFSSPEELNMPVLTDGTHPRLLDELKELLTGFKSYFALSSKSHSLREPVNSLIHGLAAFVRQDYKVEEKKFKIFGNEDD